MTQLTTGCDSTARETGETADDDEFGDRGHCLQVGFSSQSHLTQQFKRFTGMTLKQVR